MSTSKAAPVARTVAVLVLSVSPVQAGSAAKVSAGETIYGDYCSSCHGRGSRTPAEASAHVEHRNVGVDYGWAEGYRAEMAIANAKP